jgi:hypothetical protein
MSNHWQRKEMSTEFQGKQQNMWMMAMILSISKKIKKK